MKTLDKAISVSSDQLDTLTSGLMPSQHRASYRLPQHGAETDGNVIFKYKGAEYSKNEYFFGIKSDQGKKTAYQCFLEDDGPYSRKLFGPIAQKQEAQNEKLSFKNFVYKSKRHFTLVRSPPLQPSRMIRKIITPDTKYLNFENEYVYGFVWF